MNKSKVEYLDYQWNFFSGCLNGCSYCWARKRAIRFNKGDFTPKLHPELLLDPLKIKTPSRIGVCFTGDLFGDWVDTQQTVTVDVTYLLPGNLPRIVDVIDRGRLEASDTLMNWVLNTVNRCPQHTFIFLTKHPQNLCKWRFPENCWVGVSATNTKQLCGAWDYPYLTKATVKFLSLEPLQEKLEANLDNIFAFTGINWLIIGLETPMSVKTAPKVEWIKEIVEAADKQSIPVFLKNNLRSIFVRTGKEQEVFQETFSWAFDMHHFLDTGETQLRQEFPRVTK